MLKKKTVSLFIITILIISLTSISTISINTTYADTSWLDDWNYRKSKTINGSIIGEQTDYQMLTIRVHKTTGTDTSSGNNDEIQHIYVGTNVRDDFGDIRFTKADGTTLLDYYMLTYISENYADFIVKVNSIPINPNTVDIYIYYDKSDETTTSSLVNTFIDKDNFEDGIVGENPIGWIENPQTPIEVTDTAAYVKHDSKALKGDPTTTDVEYSYRSLTAITDNNDRAIYFWFKQVDNPYTKRAILSIKDAGLRIFLSPYKSGYIVYYSNGWNNIKAVSYDTWYKFKIFNIDLTNSQWDIAIDGIVEGINLGFFTDGASQLDIFSISGDGGSIGIDTLFVTKFCDPEPSWGAFGIEEEKPLIECYLTNIFYSGIKTIYINDTIKTNKTLTAFNINDFFNITSISKENYVYLWYNNNNDSISWDNPYYDVITENITLYSIAYGDYQEPTLKGNPVLIPQTDYFPLFIITVLAFFIILLGLIIYRKKS